ncbi:sugar-specific transcriptional regulator TrmB [Kribbella sp. VKM Ac-2527]|uniref:Sugar-specific transcriptional regulator TrmB n=1 Tax=Kribbella caucasensis TaxID=2512215 RepID=A0A4R6K4T5_9ACTN|nr:LuxR C-terminal-related transcriptional regulator [Kribbella sp. VKM Ac-2527]TDO44383.1 sugar-specific transcriptional regulator TrmB [Kribbella sp. VKM Ac-2527]
MLESVGVAAADEAAYRTLLSIPGCGLPDLAKRLGRDADDVRETVKRLEELGLLTSTSDVPPRLLPTRPDVAVDALVAVRRAELDRVRAEARVLLSELREQEQHRPENLVEVIVGQEAIAARFAQLLNGTKDTLMVLDRPPYAAKVEQSDNTVRGLLREGVAVRGIYSPDSLDVPGGVDEAYSAADAGESSRVHPQVPMKLAVFDRTAALLPLSVDQLVDSALVVHPCALLDALIEMFTLLWDQAVPVVPARMDPLDARLMTLLAAGFKDDAIARQLTLSSRTVGRRVAELMETLGARTRFQAGIHAQRRRLLEDS